MNQQRPPDVMPATASVSGSTTSSTSSSFITWEIAGYLLLALLVHLLIYVYVTRKRTKSIVGRHVVITGGSKGIGLCLAVECAMKGANVTVIARDEKMLSKTKITNYWGFGL